jgi:membrane protein DedA with SNARE-associated domain
MGHLPFTAANLLYLYVYAALPIAFGLTLGSLVWYLLSYIYGEPFIRKFGKYVFVKWSDIEHARHRFEKRHKSEIGLFVIRAIPLVPSIVINLVAGLMKVRLLPYVITTFLGTTIRATIIAIIGWQAGAVYRTYADVIDRSEKAIFLVIIIAVVAYIVHMKRKGK